MGTAAGEDIKRTAELGALFGMREIAWLQHQSGVLDEETWASYRSIISGALFFDSARQWWEGSFPYFDKSFVEFVNEYLEKDPTQYDPCGSYDVD